MKGLGRGPDTSRNLKVIVKLHIVLGDKIKMVKKSHVITTCLIPHSFNKDDTWLDCYYRAIFLM